jgi:peptide/nickel transport system ATP-binding protein
MPKILRRLGNGGIVMSKKLIEIKNLKKYYPLKQKDKYGNKLVVKAIDGISFDIYEGETLGLVGESGCGKTTTGRVILKILDSTSGEISYNGKDILSMDEKTFRKLRPEMQMIFQDPYGCLDPRKRIGNIIARPIKINGNFTKNEIKEKVNQLMECVGLLPEYANRFPHEFSGGQRQRVGIARAMALNPKIVVCDEPISALDVSIQAQVINLMKELQKKLNLTYLFISHDLRMVHHSSDRVAIMYLGRIVEIGTKHDIFMRPAHPYTKALLSSIPDISKSSDDEVVLEGDIPTAMDMPTGCRFHTRCNIAQEICKNVAPETKDLGNGHKCECQFV